jgi:hypothetical protein
MAAPPRTLHDIAGGVFREHKRHDHLTLAALQKQWATLVGPGLAGKTWPTRLQGGLLWVAAPDSSWAYQLQFLKQELLGGLRAGLENCPVTDLRFKVGPMPAEPADADSAAGANPSRERTSPGERSSSREPAPPPAPELARAADAIADPTLRGAFLRTLSKQARRKAKP